MRLRSKVRGQAVKNRGVVLDETKCGVAATAQQATHALATGTVAGAARMVMVNAQALATGVPYFPVTSGTQATLGFQQGFILFNRQAEPCQSILKTFDAFTRLTARGSLTSVEVRYMLNGLTCATPLFTFY